MASEDIQKSYVKMSLIMFELRIDENQAEMQYKAQDLLIYLIFFKFYFSPQNSELKKDLTQVYISASKRLQMSRGRALTVAKIRDNSQIALIGTHITEFHSGSIECFIPASYIFNN